MVLPESDSDCGDRRGGCTGDAGKEGLRELHGGAGGVGHNQTRAEAGWCRRGLGLTIYYGDGGMGLVTFRRAGNGKGHGNGGVLVTVGLGVGQHGAAFVCV